MGWMIQCIDSESQEMMLYGTVEKTCLGRLCCFARDSPHNPNFKGSFLGGKKLIPQHFQHLLICAGCSVQKGYSV